MESKIGLAIAVSLTFFNSPAWRRIGSIHLWSASSGAPFSVQSLIMEFNQRNSFILIPPQKMLQRIFLKLR